MASMTDVVFLLLVFFMLTLSAVPTTSISIDLPESSSEQSTTSSQVTLTVTAALDYYIGREKVEEEEIALVLRERLGTGGAVLLRVDRSVPVSCVVHVLDIASALHLGVAVETTRTE